MMRSSLVVCFAAFFSGAVQSRGCEDLIGLAKVTSTIVTDESEFEQRASNFCKAYRNFEKSGSSTDVDVSYKVFSGSLGTSNSTMKEVSEQYCAADGSVDSHRNAYRHYIQTIAPGAFPAYEKCKEIEQGGELRFSVGHHSDKLSSIELNFAPQGEDSQAEIEFDVPKGTDCKWVSVPTSWAGRSKATKRGAGGFSLSCSRANVSQDTYITISRLDRANESLTIPWAMSDGPRDRLADLARKVAALQVAMDKANADIASQKVENTSRKSEIATVVTNLATLDQAAIKTGQEVELDNFLFRGNCLMANQGTWTNIYACAAVDKHGKRTHWVINRK